MRGKNRGKLVFLIIIIVITSSHIVLCQTISSTNGGRKPLIITNVKHYENIVKQDNAQRMVLVKEIAPLIFLDLKYGTKDNFTGQVLYKHPQAFLRLEAAIALKKANDELRDSGYALKIWDAYRPYSVTKKMWALVNDRRYVANPAKGSAHNRGAAVDITLVKLNGEEVPMPTPFDDFTEKASHRYMNLPGNVIKNRNLLKKVMHKQGFAALPTEWWHYILPDAVERFELLDVGFEELGRLSLRK